MGTSKDPDIVHMEAKTLDGRKCCDYLFIILSEYNYVVYQRSTEHRIALGRSNGCFYDYSQSGHAINILK